jgi:hypothetical protein
MAGIETLARLAGVQIPEPVRFALSPQAYILGEIFKQIESSAGLPSKTLQTLSNPAGAAADYVKTEAGNALLDQSNMSNIERILNELQPSQFEQARTAGETPMDVPSSIQAPQYDPNSLSDLFPQQPLDMLQTFGMPTGDKGLESLMAETAYRNGGFIYRGSR